MERFTADQARDRVKEAPEIAINTIQYKDIVMGVKAASSKGETFIWYHSILLDQVRDILASDGFKIVDQSDRDGVLIKISWDV